MNKKILVVDDEPPIVELLKKRLTANHYQTVTAIGAHEGLRKAKEEKPDLILLDIMMPEMDGQETLRQLKRESETKDIPVIMLTVKTRKESIEKAILGGAADYLVKPFQSAVLLERIGGILKNA